MADHKIVLNHVLCFLFSKVHKEDEKRIVDVILKFFSESDISTARDILLEHASLAGTSLPRLPARRSVGDERKNRELKDIFLIINTMDTALILDKLPVFASNDPSEMPSANITEGDLRSIMIRLDQLDTKLDAIANIQVAMFDSQQRVNKPVNKPGQSRSDSSVVKSTTEADRGASASSSRMAGHTSAVIESTVAGPSGSKVSSGPNFSLSNKAGRNSTIDSDRQSNSISTEDCIDSEPYQLTSAARRKEQRKRRRLQSKNNSPSDQALCPDEVIKLKSDAEAIRPGYSDVIKIQTVNRNQTSKTVTRKNSHLLIGRKPRDDTQPQQGYPDKIAAAKPYLSKAVFCIDNVAAGVVVDDMFEFVTSIGVQVLTCYKVPPRRPLWQRRRGIFPTDRSTFRLCIQRKDVEKLLNADMWPENISISQWIFSKNPRQLISEEEAESLAIDQQLKVIRSMSARIDHSATDTSDSLHVQVLAASDALELTPTLPADQHLADDNSMDAIQDMDETITDPQHGE